MVFRFNEIKIVKFFDIRNSRIAKVRMIKIWIFLRFDISRHSQFQSFSYSSKRFFKFSFRTTVTLVIFFFHYLTIKTKFTEY